MNTRMLPWPAKGRQSSWGITKMAAFREFFSGSLGPLANSQKIPARVMDRIHQHEENAEILTRAIQLGIVLFFCILYFISPKLGSPGKQFITPMMLGIYVVLTTIGLLWANRGRVPDWAVYFSVIIDVSLLYALIWSFHIVYEQPPSFYLKVPTLLYVFIFIALRALRFEARFVVAAGVTAAIGWVAMFVYVIVYDEFNSMVTRDFVTYLTSNSILVGAEVDKIISILFVTGVIALSIHRARKTLEQAVIEQQAASSLSRFFDEGIASEIKDASEELDVGKGMIRQAAILNVDIRRFTKFAKDKEPDHVIQLLSEYHKRVIPIIQAHGGSIDKFLGDGILASFGALKPSETYCADSLACVEAILEEFQVWKSDPVLAAVVEQDIGMSVAHGPVIFGPVGDGQRLEFTVIGSAVNLSAKLEKHNKAMKSRAIMAVSTYDKALEQGYEPRQQCKEADVIVEGLDSSIAVMVFGTDNP